MDRELIKRAMYKNAFIGKMIGKGIAGSSKMLGAKGATILGDVGLSAARGAVPGAAVGAIAGGIQGANSQDGSFLGGALKGGLAGGALGGLGAGALRGARRGAYAYGKAGLGNTLGGIEKSVGLGRGMPKFNAGATKMNIPGAFNSKGYNFRFKKAASLNLARRILNRG